MIFTRPSLPQTSMPFALASDLGHDQLFELPNAALIALVEGPLFDSFPPDEPGLRQDFEMFAGGRLADAEFLCNEHAAHSIFDQVSINLGREVLAWLLEPFQDLPPPLTGQRAECRVRRHIDN